MYYCFFEVADLKYLINILIFSIFCIDNKFSTQIIQVFLVIETNEVNRLAFSPFQKQTKMLRKKIVLI